MTVEVTSDIAGITIREYLRGRLGYSSAMLKKLKFTEGGITVNGNFVTVRHVLTEGEVLSLMSEDRDDDVSPYIIPYDLPIDVVYEDSHITAVNKPPYMPAHPSFGHRDDTVANALAFRYKDSPYVFRPVNRLDRDTSGIMLTANTRLASYKMYRLMTEGRIRKSYIAVLDGVPEVPFGEIRSFMRRKDGSVVEREECDEDGGGKIAVTEYKTLFSNGKRSLVLASPITGRTHQLRVQFAGIGCPITGDTMYGSESDIIKRQALHAIKTEFPHPESGDPLVLYATVPEDIRKTAEEYFGDDFSAEKIIDMI
ncbi:MAG: RluA family pseudouridine synthase [Ruminococcaceae bacterium]|nr:RluA family pseudouridine synthase [Oscillospiraceae bacterium]